MRYLTAMLAVVFSATPILATDWLTLPSTYSHDPQTGMRVAQFAPATVPTGPVETSFRSSGYRQLRSTLAFGQSADNYHRVETWGDPVRPYGEWRFPYRPFSTPYPNWGPPYGGLNIGFGHQFGGGFGPGFGGGGRGPGGRPHGPGHPNGNHSGGGNSTDAGSNVSGPNAGAPNTAGPRRPSGNDGNWPSERPRFPRPSSVPPVFNGPGNPYPAGGNSPYPVAPYYDGFYPNYRD